jgi:catechol 2,3-dioxygenase
MAERSMASTYRVGHVHLKVVDLNRAIEFYTKTLGFRVTEQVDTYCFLSYGDAHHELAIHSIKGEANLPNKQTVGLYHFAIEVPTKAALCRVYADLKNTGIIVKAVNHGISKALYFTDPDGNGVEVFLDTRTENSHFEWRGISIPISETELLGGR